MQVLSHSDITIFLLALAVLLTAARVMGELARRVQQPAVVGEIFAGILLGPTVLGALAPELSQALFPQSGPVAIGLEALTTLALVLFLLVAGMEVDLSTVLRQGRSALSVSLTGIVFPFAVGFGAAWLAPRALGWDPASEKLVFTLFFATALSISALPVVAKILLDLNLFRTDMGMIVVAAAIFNDLVGWMIFAIILGMIDYGKAVTFGFGTTILLTLALAAFLLTIGRWLVDRSLPWIQAHTTWPGGVLGFGLSLALFFAAFTEWIGIHAIFGAFLFGIVLGDSSHLRERTRATLDQFISFIFAPLFFASIGLKVDFLSNFDLMLVLVVLVIASVGKVIGCAVGARISGLGRRESWAIGFGMNARGAMEIILGLLALEAGIISERMFVALVVMALVTSMTSGIFMEKILKRKKPVRFVDLLTSRNFVPELKAHTRREAVAELATMACAGTPLDPGEVAEAVLRREEVFSTGIGNGLAIPHFRVDNLKQMVLAVGVSRAGIDFNAPDGRPAHLVFLLLTPTESTGRHLEVLADIARTFRDRDNVTRAVEATGYTQFLAMLKSTPVDEDAPRALP